MSDSDTSPDRQELQAEIEETRADLGATVEALAAKTDVKARAKEAAGNAAEQAREKLASAKDTVTDTATSAKHRIAHGDIPGPARRPMPWAAIGAAAAGVAGVIVLVVRRKRS